MHPKPFLLICSPPLGRSISSPSSRISSSVVTMRMSAMVGKRSLEPEYESSTVLCMWKAAILGLIEICVACAPADQESVRTVAAVEIPLETVDDRHDLLAVLRRHAAADGELHIDDVSEKWRELEQEADTPADIRKTIYVGVWRGRDDDDIEASVDDVGHNGRAWVTFLKGRQPDRAARFRKSVLADIRRRWPGANALPVLPTGGLPLSDDLRMTPTGYKIDASAAARYELPKSSPLVAPD